MSASCAGFVSATLTNPIWFVKTRLQLDYNANAKQSVSECVRRIYATQGLTGFYKGITASYVGISETVIHFVIYEALKKKLVRILGTRRHPLTINHLSLIVLVCVRLLANPNHGEGGGA